MSILRTMSAKHDRTLLGCKRGRQTKNKTGQGIPCDRAAWQGNQRVNHVRAVIRASCSWENIKHLASIDGDAPEVTG